MAGSPPTTFQTYLTRSVPFRRRQSSVSTAASSYSHGRHESFGSISSATPPTTPLTPLFPDSFFGTSRSGSSVSGFYDYQASPPSKPGQTTDSAVTTSPRRPSFLTGHRASISCARCHADLALTSQIISKGFTGRHGRAYLIAPSPSSLSSSPCTGSVGSLPNTNTHKSVPRHLVTGMHTVADISCAMCGSVLGWKYVAAEEDAQRYKVGKFILETRRCYVGVSWELEGAAGVSLGGTSPIEDDGDMFGTGDMDELFGVVGGGVADSRRALSGTTCANQRAIPGKGKSATLQDEPELEEQDDEIMFDSQDEDECEDLFAGIWSPGLAKRRRGRRGIMAK